jgi:hypothetical protein
MMSSAAIVPKAVQVDASAHCQLACPLCPTADGRTKPGLGQGFLKLADFQSLLNRNPALEHVELSNYGEMFLNPVLPDMLAYAHERNVTVSGGNGVNLNHAREAALEAVVKYRVRTLTCSLDGATPETHAKYRVNGHLERVLKNIDRIREYRRQYRSAFPILNWQFVVFGHNEHELAAARRMAAERGMGFLPRLSWDNGFSPVQKPDLVRIETGLAGATRDEYRKNKGSGYTRDICYQLWHQPVLNWDGRMMGCCVNYWKAFDTNAFSDGLDAAANHPDLDYARSMLMGQAQPRESIPCTTCHHFEEIREDGNWITEEEVAGASSPSPIAGFLLEPAGEARFAQVSIVKGWDAEPFRQVAGRLFRFGVDTAVYFTPSFGGRYTAFIRMLGERNSIRSAAFRFAVMSRPLCQEFSSSASDFEVAQRGNHAGRAADPTSAEPCWIL